METYIAFITLSTGSKHRITQETHNQILEAGKDDFIQLDSVTTFKNSSVMEIQDISEWEEKPSYNYGQPYTALPAGQGYDGLIRTSSKRGLELMAKGLKKFIAERKEKGEPTIKSEELLQKMRTYYATKNNKQLA